MSLIPLCVFVGLAVEKQKKNLMFLLVERNRASWNISVKTLSDRKVGL